MCINVLLPLLCFAAALGYIQQQNQLSLSTVKIDHGVTHVHFFSHTLQLIDA